MSEQLKRAAELLRREAQILRESNPDTLERMGRGGAWNGNLDAKQDHDELLDAAEIVVKAIERIAALEKALADGLEHNHEAHDIVLSLDGELRTAHKTMVEQKAAIAELERQAAIGRRAVEMLSDIDRDNSRRKGLACCPSCGDWDEHHALCALAAILRDAEQAAPEPATVVDRWALVELRSFMERVTHWQEGRPDRHDAMQALGVLESVAHAVDAGALEHLRNRLEVFDSCPSDQRCAFSTARWAVIEAARRLIAEAA